MHELIEADKLDDDGKLEKKYQSLPANQAPKRLKVMNTMSKSAQVNTDTDDSNFHAKKSYSTASDSTSDSPGELVSNAEVSHGGISFQSWLSSMLNNDLQTVFSYEISLHIPFLSLRPFPLPYHSQ